MIPMTERKDTDEVDRKSKDTDEEKLFYFDDLFRPD